MLWWTLKIRITQFTCSCNEIELDKKECMLTLAHSVCAGAHKPPGTIGLFSEVIWLSWGLSVCHILADKTKLEPLLKVFID